MDKKQLISDLMRSTGIGKRAVYKRAKKAQEDFPFSSDQAYLFLARDAKLRLSDYASREEIESFQGALQSVASASRETVKPEHRSTQGVKRSGKKEYKFPNNVKIDDILRSARVSSDAVEMSKVYPMLYVLENSIREFIVEAMKKYHGDDWWEKTVNKRLKDYVVGRREGENKKSWHQKRGDRNIDYLDMADLPKLVCKFKDKLVDEGLVDNELWIQNLINEVYPSRNVLAHMNPLERLSVDTIKVKLGQWGNFVRNAYDRWGIQEKLC